MISEIKPFKKLYLKWGEEYFGWGVFTDEFILSGETVEQCYSLIDNAITSPHLDYVFNVNPQTSDVYHVLGFGAIYNHSDSPNVHPKLIDEERRVIEFRALRDIEIGEELRWNYGPGYWKNKKKKLI